MVIKRPLKTPERPYSLNPCLELTLKLVATFPTTNQTFNFTQLLQCLLSVLEGKEHEERLAMELHHNEAFEDDEGIAESGM